MSALATEAPVVTATPLRATVTRDDLVDALRWAMQGVPSRPPVPILACVLLYADDQGGLLVRGFDYDTFAEATVTAPGASGAVAVHARTFQRMLAALPKGASLVLTGMSKSLRIVGGGVDYSLPVFPLDQVPEAPDVKVGHRFTLTGQTLEAMAAVTVAAGRDDTLPVLTGVLLDGTDGGRLTVAATDRYRLAALSLPDMLVPETFKVLIPARSLKRAVAGFKRERSVQFTVGVSTEHHDTRVSLVAPGRALIFRALDGEFPKYRALLPDTFERTLEVEAEEFAARTRQVEAALDRHQPLVLHLGQGEPSIASRAQGDDAERHDVPTARATLAGTFTGEQVDVAFNPGYLLDGVTVLGGKVTMSLNAPTRPSVLTSDARPGFRYLLMPVRMSG